MPSTSAIVQRTVAGAGQGLPLMGLVLAGPTIVLLAGEGALFCPTGNQRRRRRHCWTRGPDSGQGRARDYLEKGGGNTPPGTVAPDDPGMGPSGHPQVRARREGLCFRIQ
jgi:hypothetical protein